MSSQHPAGLSTLESRKMVRNITMNLTRSFSGWYLFEPNLNRYAGIDSEDIQGAFLSAAVAMAKIAFKHIEIHCTRTEPHSFLVTHCDHSFNFPGMPDEFLGSVFLNRVTHAEWAALGTALMPPVWLETAIIEWAQSQKLTLKVQAA